jgi:hypothetical protein
MSEQHHNKSDSKNLRLERLFKEYNLGESCEEHRRQIYKAKKELKKQDEKSRQKLAFLDSISSLHFKVLQELNKTFITDETCEKILKILKENENSRFSMIV